MFRLQTEDELRRAFRPKDLSALELPADMRFPLMVPDYLAWTHPAGGKVFLVFAQGLKSAPTGITFDLTSGGSVGVPAMCDWCHSPGAGTEIGLLTARLNSKKRVGVNVCCDLSCKRKLEDDAARNGQNVWPKIQKLIEKMAQFAQDGLHIDLTGAGRP